MTQVRPLACVVVLASVLCASAAGRSREMSGGPAVGLNPSRPHVWIYGPEHWNLKLYDTPAMKGRPTIELNDHGLFANGALACSWPDGKWDPSNTGNMVLGYRTSASSYTGCNPADLPIVSTWGDNGLGAAAHYIEVVAFTKTIAEAEWRGQRLFFDLDALPGDPNDPKPSFRLARKGFIGWEWMPSERVSRRRTALAFARLLREPAFSQFFHSVRHCIRSADAPNCLIPFVQSPFYDSDAGDDVSAADWVRYAWGQRNEWSERKWDLLDSCFFGERAVTAGPRFVQFGPSPLCDVELSHGKWRLTSVDIGE